MGRHGIKLGADQEVHRAMSRSCEEKEPPTLTVTLSDPPSTTPTLYLLCWDICSIYMGDHHEGLYSRSLETAEKQRPAHVRGL